MQVENLPRRRKDETGPDILILLSPSHPAFLSVSVPLIVSVCRAAPIVLRLTASFPCVSLSLSFCLLGVACPAPFAPEGAVFSIHSVGTSYVPAWLRRPVTASFAFGGKVVSVTNEGDSPSIAAGMEEPGQNTVRHLALFLPCLSSLCFSFCLCVSLFQFGMVHLLPSPPSFYRLFSFFLPSLLYPALSVFFS